MDYKYEIPDSFWSLFRSVNREIYIEALLTVSEEYEYNNYFLSREACVQLLSDMCSAHRLRLEREETESDEEAGETVSRRILNRLVKTGWLRKVEDYSSMSTNMVIPDYAAVMIEALEKLAFGEQEDTEVYIQNVYATLFSFRNDARRNLSLLRTALVNTRKLNKALQDMLHNMDRFFDRLLSRDSYSELLREHLEGYVEQVVERKYHILKTSDNFYIYKADIRRWLKEMREDEDWLEQVRTSQTPGTEPVGLLNRRAEDVEDLLEQMERGFEMIERRIAVLDREHSKYIRATVSRLNYLLSEENDRHGLLIQLLNHLGSPEEETERDRRLRLTAGRMNLSSWDVLSENPLYRRRRRKPFVEDLQAEEEDRELDLEEVLRLNRIHHRFTRQQVEDFIEEHAQDGCLDTSRLKLEDGEELDKLILAYDLSMRKDSRFEVIDAGYQVEDGAYTYPAMLFVRRKGKENA